MEASAGVDVWRVELLALSAGIVAESASVEPLLPEVRVLPREDCESRLLSVGEGGAIVIATDPEAAGSERNDLL